MKKDIKPFLFFSIIASLLVGHLANLVLKEDKTVGFDFPPRK